MTNKNIATLKRGINKNQAMVVLPLKEWEKREKEMAELKDVMEAILEGEADLREGRTQSFRDFIKKDFPQYAKNK